MRGVRTLIVALWACWLPLAAQAEPIQVKVVTATVVEGAVNITLTGAIEARTQSDLAFRISGKVVARTVEVGQHVVAGDVIATLDDAQQRADVDAAKAQLAAKQAVLDPAAIDLDRQKQLFANGFTPKRRLDDAQTVVTQATADVVAAKAALASAEEQLGYTVLTSTGDGVIVARDVDVGAVVQAGTRVVSLARDGPRDAVFAVAETDAMRPPLEADVQLALTTDRTVHTTGRVREVAPQVDAATNTVKVKVGLEGVPPAMTLGAAVTGSAVTARRPSVTLPWGSLDRWRGAAAVWVLSGENKPEPRNVSILRYRTGSFDVGDGLKAGERVVVAGVQFLRPDAAVTVVDGATP